MPPGVIVLGAALATDPFGIVSSRLANDHGRERTGLCFGTADIRCKLVVDGLPRNRARTAMYQAGQVELGSRRTGERSCIRNDLSKQQRGY